MSNLKQLNARQAQSAAAKAVENGQAGPAFDVDQMIAAAGGVPNTNPNAKAVLTLEPNADGAGLKITTFFEDGFAPDNGAHQALAWVMEQIQAASAQQGHGALLKLTEPEYVTGAQAEAALKTGEVSSAAPDAGVIQTERQGIRRLDGSLLQ